MRSACLIIVLLSLFSLNLAFQITEMEKWPENGKRRFKEKITQFRQQRMEACKDEARTIAAKMVDSVITAKYILISIDTFERPSKPIKPEQPQFPYQVDTSQPEKLFEQED